MDLIASSIVRRMRELAAELAGIPEPDRIEALNDIRLSLHESSPFAEEPVECVLWVPADSVKANEYNPNRVAPPEMRLLEHSIASDGFTQPIVTHEDECGYTVVDGFHRNRVGKESAKIRKRLNGYLPIVRIRASQADTEKRMASTIRHNRARGKHAVEPLTGIVVYLAKKGWDDEKIGKELGMDPSEVLRFKQISGLAELFADKDFSKSWEIA